MSENIDDSFDAQWEAAAEEAAAGRGTVRDAEDNDEGVGAALTSSNNSNKKSRVEKEDDDEEKKMAAEDTPLPLPTNDNNYNDDYEEECVICLEELNKLPWGRCTPCNHGEYFCIF